MSDSHRFGDIFVIDVIAALCGRGNQPAFLAPLYALVSASAHSGPRYCAIIRGVAQCLLFSYRLPKRDAEDLKKAWGLRRTAVDRSASNNMRRTAAAPPEPFTENDMKTASLPETICPPPPRRGLYDPQLEHDACGVGMICNIKGQKSHDIVQTALQMAVNLTHRGACGCDATTGDGAGITTAGAAVGQVDGHLQGRLDDIVRLLPLDVADHADTAGVVFQLGIVEPPTRRRRADGLRQGCYLHFVFREGLRRRGSGQRLLFDADRSTAGRLRPHAFFKSSASRFGNLYENSKHCATPRMIAQ